MGSGTRGMVGIITMKACIDKVAHIPFSWFSGTNDPDSAIMVNPVLTMTSSIIKDYHIPVVPMAIVALFLLSGTNCPRISDPETPFRKGETAPAARGTVS